jgi:mannose-6-phosphate isomerase-like protein (cupin superfamily)
MIEVVDLEEKLSLFSESWQPKIVGQVNDTLVKLVKFTGDFVWHHHDHEDELFFVVRGRFTMKLHEGDVVIEAGQFITIPHGIEHCPCAAEECCVMLLEPATTLNTGNVRNERTLERLERL